jgi:RNA ligase
VTALPHLSALVALDDVRSAVADGFIRCTPHPSKPLTILTYTRAAQYANMWTPATRLCRGLIVAGDPLTSDPVVIARPFPKFGNVEHHGPSSPFGQLPTGPFDVFDKIDGSLVIVATDPADGELVITTKNQFVSPHTAAFARWWQEKYPDVRPDVGVTFLAEYIAPDNRVVIDYGDRTDMVALAAIDVTSGADLPIPAWWNGEVAAARTEFASVADVVAYAGREGVMEEGFVLRFAPTVPGGPSPRVKAKLGDYVRLHAALSNISTVVIWEMLSSGQSFDDLFAAVPDEVDQWIRAEIEALSGQVDTILERARRAVADVAGLPRKEQAHIINAAPDVDKYVCFQLLDGFDPLPHLWKKVRPEYRTPFTDITDTAA